MVSMTALPAPAWDFWAVLGTAAVGALIALFIDFLLKPRLQVRTERFTQRAKDRVELERVVRSMYISAEQLMDVPTDLDDFAIQVLSDHQKTIRDSLLSRTFELEAAYGAAGQRLPEPVVRLIEMTGGLVRGVCWSKQPNSEVRKQISPQLRLLYDVLATPRVRYRSYRHHLARVKEAVADKCSG